VNTEELGKKERELDAKLRESSEELKVLDPITKAYNFEQGVVRV